MWNVIPSKGLQNLGSTNNRKVTKPWFDSRCGSALLCPWERYLMQLLTLGPSSLPVVVAQPNERHANRAASVLIFY